MTAYKRTRTERRFWHEGVIGIPVGKEKSIPAHYWVKAYDEPSEYGIEDGRISKMEVQINGETAIRYDRGWDVYPETEDANLAYAILMQEYN